MIKHRHTESTKINFSKLDDRLLSINDPFLGQFNSIREMLYELTIENKPTLIVATGGSKIIANYLQLIVERLGFGILCEVIEPRDYFYKSNRDSFSNLIAISASGKTNGIEEVLTAFKGRKFLICEQRKEQTYDVIDWGNELYDREKSFISLATSLGPMALLLDATTSINMELLPHEIQKINDKIRELLARSANKIAKLDVDFKDIDLIQIMSGYETKTSCSVLESNLAEVGLAAPVIHDKGSFCHGRSNLLFQYPKSRIIYLAHELKELDHVLIDTIQNEYGNLELFCSETLDETIFWKEYYLSLQMYFLSRKIAQDKNIDFTMPEYNPRLIKKIYNFRGEM